MEVDSVDGVGGGEICTQAQSGDGMRTWRLTSQTDQRAKSRAGERVSEWARQTQGQRPVEQLSRSGQRFEITEEQRCRAAGAVQKGPAEPEVEA